MKRLNTLRDVLILRGQGLCLVTAVDSCGGIGPKAHDALNVPLDVVGRYTARTVLLEVLATGAAPAFAAISVCNEPETAEELLRGIRAVLGSIPWTVSTEKNMPTAMTALGISLTGSCGPQKLRVGRSRPGDLLCLSGLPLVGQELLLPDAAVFDVAHMDRLLSSSVVGSILPVGSRGVAAESAVLAAESGLEAALDLDCGIDLIKSAGPSSCVLFSLRNEPGDLDIPYVVVGALK